MAAQDTFEGFNASLTEAQRVQLRDFAKLKREELLASRSEDARVRLVHEYIKDVHERMSQGR